jgi:hypothetical protein
MGTKENAVRIALLQVAVVLFGVLASAACLRLVENTGLPGMATVTVFMTEHGWMLLLLPLGWTWLMVRRPNRDEAAEGARPMMFLAGVLLLLGLCLLAVIAILQPWGVLQGQAANLALTTSSAV